MNQTMSEIGIVIAMVVVIVTLLVWFHRSKAAASTRRMMRMMTCAGLDARMVARGNPSAKATIKTARWHCGRCSVEGLCERWFAGKAKGDNSFCPNARTFRALKETREFTA